MQNTYRRVPIFSNAKTNAISTSKAQPVKGGSSGTTVTMWSVDQFDVEGKMVVPLRKNYTTAYDKLYQSKGIFVGNMGYYGTGRFQTIRVKVRFKCLGTPKKVDYTLTIKSGTAELGNSSSVVISAVNTEYEFKISGFKTEKGFYKQTVYFCFSYKSEHGNEGAQLIPITLYHFPLKPQKPWSCEKGKKNNPWTEVLDLLLQKG